MRLHITVLLLSTIGFSILGSMGCEAEVRDFGSGGGSSSSGVIAGTSSGISSGTLIPDGDCLSDADCLSGSCVELVPGGYRVCSAAPMTNPCMDPMFDKCCTDTDCQMPGERCVTGPVTPNCGGPFMPPQNMCAIDQCVSDADCQMMGDASICVLAGLLNRPVNTCLAASCLSHLDCTEEPDGKCVLHAPACCTGPTNLACAYPSDGCRWDIDCPPEFYCDLQGGRARCVPGAVACPK